MRRLAARIIGRIAASGLVGDLFVLRQTGHCPICQGPAVFVSRSAWFRDRLRCTQCQSIPRQRAILSVIEDVFPDWRSFRIHESSPGEGAASGVLQAGCPGYIGSHFHPNHPFGSSVDGFRNENLEDQTFEDAMFDLVVTQDVMEHIYNPEAAFREISRTLKPGGAHVFTVPMINRYKPTEVWARMNPDGSPDFLHEPEWHGNPISAEGSPVTMHWGTDIVDFIARATDGDRSEILHTYDPERGIMGEFCEVIISRKV